MFDNKNPQYDSFRFFKEGLIEQFCMNPETVYCGEESYNWIFNSPEKWSLRIKENARLNIDNTSFEFANKDQYLEIQRIVFKAINDRLPREFTIFPEGNLSFINNNPQTTISFDTLEQILQTAILLAVELDFIWDTAGQIIKGDK